MTRDTISDRARKRRIREREYRHKLRQAQKLDNITDEQIAVLKQIKAAEASNTPVTTASIPNWKELHEMGVVRERDGILVLTSVGAQAAASQ